MNKKFWATTFTLTGTVIGAGKEIAKNDIETFPYVVRHRGIAELQNLYKDKPAILVNTGPSLQKNIHLLMNKEVREKCIIISIAQALRILLAYGIEPNFIKQLTTELSIKSILNIFGIVIYLLSV